MRFTSVFNNNLENIKPLQSKNLKWFQFFTFPKFNFFMIFSFILFFYLWYLFPFSAKIGKHFASSIKQFYLNDWFSCQKNLVWFPSWLFEWEMAKKWLRLPFRWTPGGLWASSDSQSTNHSILLSWQVLYLSYCCCCCCCCCCWV